MALWNELALPGACGKGGPEGEVFWKKLSEKCPWAADQVKALAVQRVEQREHAMHTKQDLAKACRAFFLSAAEAAVTSVSDKIGYLEAEGKEPCFEVRGSRQIVKGTGNTQWLAGGPTTKMEAIKHESTDYDALRLSVFVGRDSGLCAEVLQQVAAEFQCPEADALQDALGACAHESVGQAAPHDLPKELEEAILDAYLSTILMPNYFFSYDEIAVVADMRLQSLLVVKGESASFVPCCVVHHGGARPVVILVKDTAVTDHRMRSHFERLAPRMAVAKSCEARHPNPKLQKCESKENCEEGVREVKSAEAEKTVRKYPEQKGVAGTACLQAKHEDNFMWQGPSVDGGQEMEEAVTAVLQAFQHGGNVRSILKQIQSFSVEVKEVDAQTMRARLKAAVAEYSTCNMTGDGELVSGRVASLLICVCRWVAQPPIVTRK